MAAYTNSLQIEKFVKELDLNTDNLFGITPIINFVIDKHKQFFLLLLTFLIILAVDYITYYNNLVYAITPNIPGVNQKPPEQIKSNTFKKKPRKFKK
jgi:hypothetical protein